LDLKDHAVNENEAMLE